MDLARLGPSHFEYAAPCVAGPPPSRCRFMDQLGRLAFGLTAQLAFPRCSHRGVHLGGFCHGNVLGLVLSICIVHSRTLDRALLPWVVASQSVPVLAIAPIVLVILGSMGFSGVAPKAVIAMYLCFFPVTVAMVQGLRSPQVIETEMMHTYAASRWQALWMLRLPAALPFLFPALRVGIAAGLVGAMVAELPTGAQAGLGARLLTGSYYGQTIQIWSALVMSALLGLTLTGIVAAIETWVLGQRRQA